MTTVGIRELKTHLSEHVRRARSGEVLLVSNRGQVVAQLGPPQGVASHPGDGLEEMARRGLVRLAVVPNDPSLYRPLPPVTTNEEVRGDR
jgi:antitoxin (DNA-binding transcriptional repressor) of toxin-antitoxin stability system